MPSVINGMPTVSDIGDILKDCTMDEIREMIDYSDTAEELVYELTKGYFLTHRDFYDARTTSKELMKVFIMGFQIKNQTLTSKWKVPKELPASALATALSKTGDFALIQTDDNTDPSLYVYHERGYHAGTYRYVDTKDTTGEFHKIVRKWNYTASSAYRKEVLLYLADEAPVLTETADDAYVPVKNGVFNVKTMKFISNDDPRYRKEFVFLKKADVDYNPLASVNPSIVDPDTGDVYDVESFMDSYFGHDTPMTRLLWELLYALVRYKKNYKVCHFFVNVDDGNNAGSNGKSTLLDLMRNLLGKGNFCSIKPHDMDKDFALAPLHDTSAILVDEVSATEPIVTIDILKTLATRNASINTQKKFHDIRTGKWDGNMVFASNGWLKILEKTGAAERRFYFWKFVKRFVGSSDKSFIADVFVKDKRVLEYILYKILHMGDIKQLSRPQEIDDNLSEYRAATCNTVHEFLNEFALPDASGNIPLVWSMQPFAWLYEFYKCWLHKDLGMPNKMTKKTFRKEVIAWTALHADIWEYRGGAVARPKGVMEQSEPLLCKYEIYSWMDNALPKPNSAPCLVNTYTNALVRR